MERPEYRLQINGASRLQRERGEVRCNVKERNRRSVLYGAPNSEPSKWVTSALRDLRGKPIVIASHPRSGTHVTLDLFRKQFSECQTWKYWGEYTNRLYVSLEALFLPSSRAPISECKAIAVLKRVKRPLIKTHILPEEVPIGPFGTRGVLGAYWLDFLKLHTQLCYVYRDGRNVMCSYHLYSKMHDLEARCSLGDFIRQDDRGMSRVKRWAHHVRSWLRLPNVYPVQFEHMMNEPLEAIQEIARHFRLTPLLRKPLLPAKFQNVWHARFTRAFGVRPECTAILGRPRGHTLERWQAAFTSADREFFHQEAGDLLIHLGYEDSDAWVNV
ncbi:hypothetical protein BH24PSE2_BH24PSE2_18910 [soil metagenome]